MLRLEGDAEGALAAAERAFADIAAVGTSHQTVKTGFVEAVDAALTLGQHDKAETFIRRIDGLRPGEKPPFVLAHASRFSARLAAARGEHEDIEARFTDAERIFREFRITFWLAVTELEHAEWLRDQGRADEAEPLLTEAREIFERLEAGPWLERASGVAVAA